jgi:hydrogenase maturation protein HypF
MPCSKQSRERGAAISTVAILAEYAAQHCIKLPFSGPSVLACGAWLKNSVCLTRGDEAFVSECVGDLDSPAACMAHEKACQDLADILQTEPASVAHDLHPDFFSSRFAARYAGERGLPLLAVQHHHAHIAAVMAEHGVLEPVLGLALDGVGLGTDGKGWGGELLCVGSDGSFARLGHLRELALPGGDRAAREPWRMAASALHALGRAGEIATRFAEPGAAMVAQMLDQDFNSPLTSSAGRWFDTAAGLLGICAKMRFEAEAAMALEQLAAAHGPVAPLEHGFVIREEGTLDLLPLMAVLSEIKDAAYGAALFHHTLVQGLAVWVERAAEQAGLSMVGLGGGCFLNRILNRGLTEKLQGQGFTVLQPVRVSPGDAAISLGQAYVALLRWRSATCA